MKKISKLKVLTVALMIMLIVCSAKVNFAAQITNIGNSTGNTSNNTIVENVQQNNIVANNTPVNNTPAPVNNTLPDTGSESSTGILVLIALTSISAIYTYIKVRKYNI